MYAIVDRSSGHSHGDHVACADCNVRHLSICNALAPEELCDLEKLSQPKTFAMRQTLFSQGEPADGIYNVKKGVLRLYKLLANGRRQIVGFALPGDFLGLSLNDSFSVSADALTEVDACRFDRKDFIAFVDVKPRLLKSIHTFTSNELLIGQEQMVLLGRRPAEERIAAFLLGWRDRCRRIGMCDVTLSLPMTRQDIADYCGLTLETVSRTFSRLARDRLIVIVPDGVRLILIDRLRTLIA